MQLPLLPIKNLDQRHKGISQPLADSYVEALVQCLLTRHLSTYDDHTRRFAMQALRRIGSRHAIELLRKVLNGPRRIDPPEGLGGPCLA